MTKQALSDRQRVRRAATADGLVAGLLGGLTVVAFFLILDATQGDPTRTATALASAVLGMDPDTVGAPHLTLLIGVHLAVFSVVGLGAVWLFQLTRVPQNMPVGALYGLVVYTLLFYLAFSLSHLPVLEVPPWPTAMAGNLLAGIVMGAYLHRVGPLHGRGTQLSLMRDHPVLREGMVGGLLAAAALAGWFLVGDLIMGEPFRTSATLGSMVFLSAEGPEAVVRSANMVLGYTAVHVATFLVLGVLFAGSVTGLERVPGLVSAILLFFVLLAVAFVGMVITVGVWILEYLSIWSILAGHLLAAGTIGAYLWRVHPVLREEIRTGVLWREL